MTWVRIDDAFAEHPKVLGLDNGSFRLHVRGLCYAARYLTDGIVPFGFATEHESAALVEAELWTRTDDGYLIHDFLEYNPSRESVEAEREAARRRMSRRRSGEPTGKRSANDGRGSPSPLPLPEPLNPEVQNPSATTASRVRRSYPAAFEAFWQAYPSEGRRDKPKAFAEWERAVGRLEAELGSRELAVARIVAGAMQYAADPNRDPAKTKYAQGWLSGDRWNDPPLPADSPNGRAVPGARSHALARELGS